MHNAPRYDDQGSPSESLLGLKITTSDDWPLDRVGLSVLEAGQRSGAELIQREIMAWHLTDARATQGRERGGGGGGGGVPVNLLLDISAKM